MSKYQFVRLRDNGCLASISPCKTFDTIDAAKLAAPDFLSARKGGGSLVLIQVLEVAIPTANIRYEKWDANKFYSK